MKMKRIMGFFLALVMFIGCLPLNTIETYAAEGDVAIDEAHFPDEKFRNYVKNNFDENGDGNLSQVERDHVKVIDVHYSNIGNLKGIEHFKNLTYLDCHNNELKSLDVSNNTNLNYLDCSFNNLKELDIYNNTNLNYLDCSGDNLTSLDVSNNKELSTLNCSDNSIASLNLSNNENLFELYCGENSLDCLDLSENKNLTELDCNNNKLTSLDLSKNTNLTELDCSNQEYYITVIKGIREFKYSDFPGQFKKDKVTSQVGASFGTDALTVDSDDTNKVTYNYKVDDNREMDVTLNVDYIEFDPEHVESMKVKEQPKLIYTEGEKLDLSGLVVTLTDNQGLTKDVAFKDFEANGITTNPKNGAVLTLADDNQPVTISKGSLQDETNKLTVNKKVFDPNHVVDMVVKTQPKLIYTEGEKLDLSGLEVTLTDNQGLTKDVAFKDFETYKITTNPENGAELTLNDNNKPVTLTKGNLKAETANLTVNEKVFDPEHVVSMKVKTQPKLIYTEGEKLDLSGLVVTLTDKQGLTKDVEFKDFEENNITAQPENDTKLTVADSGKKVTLTKGNLTAETNALTVNEKVFDPEHVEKMVVTTQPKLIYTEGEKLDLSKLVVTLTDKQGLTKDVEFKDFETYKITTNPKNETDLTSEDNGKKVSLTKENSTEETEALTKDVAFRDFASNVITTNLIDDTALTLANNGKALKLTKGNPITAETEALTVKEKPTPPPTPTPDPPQEYWTVTFESADETKGVVDANNKVSVLKNSGKTLADIAKDAPKVTAKAGFKFTGWEPALDKNTVIDKDMTVKAHFKKAGTPTPQDPTDPTDPPAPPQEYWIVTFKSEDETKGTVDANNKVSVLKNSGKTLADLAKDAPKVTAKAGFKFTGWEPALDKNTSINGNLTVNAKFEKVKVAKKPKVANNKALPKTASSMNIELYTFLMILSAGLLVVAFKRKKRVNR